MVDLSHLETDDALENEGVETELSNLPGATVRLLGIGSRAYDEAQFAVARELRLEEVPEEARDTESRVRMAAKLTVGWSELTDKGEPFPYSYENACALYRRLPRVRGEALRFIANPVHFKPAPYDLRADPDAEGNSAPSLSGAGADKDGTSSGSET